MVIILSFGQTGLGKHVDPDRIKEQSGQSPHCLSFHLHLYSMVKPHCSDFKIIAAILWVSEFFLFLQHIWAVSWQNQQNDCVPSEDSDQPGHPPSLIPPSQRRLRSVRMKKAWILATYWAHSEDSDQPGHPLWSDWADAQADMSLRWAHNHFVGFVMRRIHVNPSWWTWGRFGFHFREFEVSKMRKEF